MHDAFPEWRLEYLSRLLVACNFDVVVIDTVVIEESDDHDV